MNELITPPRLVDYSSDEATSDENEVVHGETVKTKHQTTTTKADYSVPDVVQKNDVLPLPFEIQQMYKGTPIEAENEDNSKHGGKIRSFPHERGVWATYVYIDFNPEPDFYDMIDKLKETSSIHGIDLRIQEDFHVSLTKTLKLRHHWITPFIDALKSKLSCFYQFKIIFQSLEVYENEEKTRTFLGLKVHSGYEHLLKLLNKVDTCVSEFKLPIFYQNPSFHLSCASCVGSKSEQLESLLADLNVIFHSFVDSHPDCRRLSVGKICCKSGNKLFSINLKS